MKESDQTRDLNLSWDFEQTVDFLRPSVRLRLNALDFTDLWDEEDSTEEESCPPCDTSRGLSLPSPPPPPPLPPPVPVPSLDKGNTLKLHWRALQSLPTLPRLTRFGAETIWAGLEPVQVDPNRLEYLFESKGGGASFSVTCAQKKQPCVCVLGVKRSNIVTIALSSLPPARLLPPAIYNMDNSVLDREDLQRLQSIVPTEEEMCLIKEAQARTPQCPLAPAEQCLLTLGEVPHLSTRLQLWAFALDYDSMEREIAEPLFHLKLAMEQLSGSATFRWILATVLAIGNFLNGCKARGFELSYLGKLSQVRDTHSRQPLLHHVCSLLTQIYPQSSDLYSDITAVTRAGKCDYLLVQSNLSQLEALCKASWEQLKVLDKADEKKRKEGRGERRRSHEEQSTDGAMRRRLPKFLKECEERLKVLRAVHRRVINRFHSFLLFLGYSRSMVRDTRAEDFCKTISDFSLEYRATRQTILQQREKEREGQREGQKEGQKERQRGREEEKERGRGGRGAVNPWNSTAKRERRNQLLSTTQDCEDQSKLEEILKTAESLYRLDLTLPRNRHRKTEGQGPFSRKFKW